MMSDLEHRHMDTQIKPNMHSSVRKSEQKAKHSFRGDSFSSIKLVTYGKKKGKEIARTGQMRQKNPSKH